MGLARAVELAEDLLAFKAYFLGVAASIARMLLISTLFVFASLVASRYETAVGTLDPVLPVLAVIPAVVLILYFRRVSRALGLPRRLADPREVGWGTTLAVLGPYLASLALTVLALSFLGLDVDPGNVVAYGFLGLCFMVDAERVCYLSRRVGWRVGLYSSSASAAVVGAAAGLSAPFSLDFVVLFSGVALAYAVLLSACAGGYLWYTKTVLARE